MAFPVKMWGPYDGTDAKGRNVHFDDSIWEGQIIGNACARTHPDPVGPWGVVETQENGEIWIVDASHLCPRCGKHTEACYCGRCQDCGVPLTPGGRCQDGCHHV